MPLDRDQFRKNTEADGYSPDVLRADEFVVVPETDGEIDFAVITEELSRVSGLVSVPIRLLNGRQRGTGGYGVTHILYQHGATLARADYYSVQDFVDDVSQEFDAVYQGRDERWLIVVKKDRNMALDRLLVLELSDSQEFYSVVSGWVVSSRRRINGVLVAERENKNGVLVWESRAPDSI